MHTNTHTQTGTYGWTSLGICGACGNVLFYERCPGTVIGNKLYVRACVRVMSVRGVIFSPMSKQHNIRVNTCYYAASSLWAALCQNVLFSFFFLSLLGVEMNRAFFGLAVTVCNPKGYLEEFMALTIFEILNIEFNI